MFPQNVSICFFSGTGNTLLVVKKIQEALQETDRDVKILPMEKEDPPVLSAGRVLGLAFPVACFSTYPFVRNFIQRLPRADNVPVFLTVTMAACAGGVVGAMRRILLEKGYKPVGAAAIIMPSNFHVARRNAESEQKKIAGGLAKAANFANRLAEGRASWGRVPLISDLLFELGCSSLPWREMARAGAKYRADPGLCSRCGLCVRLCPVENIVMEERPLFLDHCVQCMRCYAFCPESAIIMPGKSFARYRSVDADDLLI